MFHKDKHVVKIFWAESLISNVKIASFMLPIFPEVQLCQEGRVKLFDLFLIYSSKTWKDQTGLHSSPQQQVWVAREITLEMWVHRESLEASEASYLFHRMLCSFACLHWIYNGRHPVLDSLHWNCFVWQKAAFRPQRLNTCTQDTLAERWCGKELLPVVHQQFCILPQSLHTSYEVPITP